MRLFIYAFQSVNAIVTDEKEIFFQTLGHEYPHDDKVESKLNGCDTISWKYRSENERNKHQH